MGSKWQSRASCRWQWSPDGGRQDLTQRLCGSCTEPIAPEAPTNPGALPQPTVPGRMRGDRGLYPQTGPQELAGGKHGLQGPRSGGRQKGEKGRQWTSERRVDSG